MNPYEPENPLQQAYNAAYPGCLCGHFESCPNCDGALDLLRLSLEKFALTMGYTLYLPWDTEKPVRRSFSRVSDIPEYKGSISGGKVWRRSPGIAERLMSGFDETSEKAE